MKKKALLIFIVIALFLTVLFLSRAFTAPSLWQQAPIASLYQAQLKPDVRPANPDVSGSWYSQMNPKNQPKYYWYNSPRNSGWNNAYKNWWCW
ncbi:hypothetical protein DP73_11125 [Desulfosporosinus sp. HMP52]|uniref:hypothetical protein n=1 Tax=Desulfosporosinus sp. HMP52 TaxID=1487923 RepID=UPI00051F9D70|nr:hypothetical protein [Desulfosporosinus sp. HMP52]KGK89113.1 hypothetical protein DP73_11125 [Desulfosporosinus sp. HMP52]